jgi:hypothetical protein
MVIWCVSCRAPTRAPVPVLDDPWCDTRAATAQSSSATAWRYWPSRIPAGCAGILAPGRWTTSYPAAQVVETRRIISRRRMGTTIGSDVVASTTGATSATRRGRATRAVGRSRAHRCTDRGTGDRMNGMLRVDGSGVRQVYDVGCVVGCDFQVTGRHARRGGRVLCRPPGEAATTIHPR